MNIKTALKDNHSDLTGIAFTDDDRERLIGFFSNLKYLDQLLLEFVGYKVVNHIFTLDASKDESGMGAELRWMKPSEQIEEARDFYPGKAATDHGYFPFGECLVGSGDPYFLKNESDNWFVYRIPHDAVVEEDLDIEKVELVAPLVSLFE